MTQFAPLSPAQLRSLLSSIRSNTVKDYEYSGKDGWGSGEEVIFVPRCDCWDELGKSPCSITVFLKTREELVNRGRLERIVLSWAKSNLKWDGCGACGGELEVDVRVFGKPVVERDRDKIKNQQKEKDYVEQ